MKSIRDHIVLLGAVLLTCYAIFHLGEISVKYAENEMKQKSVKVRRVK